MPYSAQQSTDLVAYLRPVADEPTPNPLQRLQGLVAQSTCWERSPSLPSLLAESPQRHGDQIFLIESDSVSPSQVRTISLVTDPL